MLTVDTGLAEATCNSGGLGMEQEYGAGGEGDNPPVIDTTSVEVERKADGKDDGQLDRWLGPTQKIRL